MALFILACGWLVAELKCRRWRLIAEARQGEPDGLRAEQHRRALVGLERATLASLALPNVATWHCLAPSRWMH